MKSHIAIIGGGMGGTFMSILLAKKGYTVSLYEKRPDIRTLPLHSNRSINQSLSLRGVRILEDIGLWSSLKNIMLVETGRTVHTIGGRTFYSPYGIDDTEVHYEFNRNTLNCALLDIAASLPLVTIHFHMRCIGIDAENRTVTFEDTKTGKRTTTNQDMVIGADGVYSVVRSSMELRGITKTKRLALDGGYKSFYIPPSDNKKISLSNDTFHMWPRNDSFLFAISNIDGSMMFTIILPNLGTKNFSSFATDQEIFSFFNKNFSDISLIVPLFVDGFKKNKMGHLECLYTSSWHDETFAVLLGDACHAIMPFYGQGVSATFEDCIGLMKYIENFAPNWKRIFSLYQLSRKRNTDVLTDLSTQRFLELKDGFRSKKYLAQQNIETILSRLFPSFWKPLYSLITHTSMPYADAYRRYRIQQRIASLLGMDFFILLYTFFRKENK